MAFKTRYLRMRNLLSIGLILSSLLLAGQDSLYHIRLDLRAVSDDRLPVHISTPVIEQDTVEFHMPRIVPGTYSISDFGRFISDFYALDAQGDTLPVRRLDVNRWQIADARLLTQITYKVADTYDKNDGYQDNFIFEPGGTSLEVDRGVFVLNTFGIVGYLADNLFRPIELDIGHHPQHYGATSLTRTVLDSVTDRFYADNYHILADGPILYCKPDTALKKIDGSDILISVYSPRGKLKASDLMNHLDDLIEAQTRYLGGSLPVDRYTYLVYLLTRNTLSKGMGALEHSYSSLYTLPEAGIRLLGDVVRDVAAHEFLHIVTPLNIHSEQIHNFDYINPEMSRHLWLYEGVTEYSALHVQVRNNLMDEAVFLDKIKEKIEVSGRFPDVSFTEMSRHILEDEYADMYLNVYYKGALIGLCLDLLLIHHSDGQTDLPGLLQKLAEKYGPHRAFEDDQILDEITAMTYPEIGLFLDRHVAGSQPLPLNEIFSLAGYTYKEKEKIKAPTLGNLPLTTNENHQIVVSNVLELNDFGKEMGYQKGDIITSINGQEVTLDNVQEVLGHFQESVQPGDKVKVTVLRNSGDKQKTVKLKAKAEIIETVQYLDIYPMDSPSDKQKKTKKIWLYGRS